MALPFLNPWMLVAASGVALPVLIHLFNRRRYRVIEWAAMHLLRRAVHVRARQVRLEDVLLMALRCLIVLLVALAAARPTMRLSAPTKDADVGAVIALDASYSMRHAPGVKSRFDRATEHVRSILATMARGSPVTLALMGEQLDVVVRNTGYDEERFREALDGLKPSEGTLELEGCLSDLKPLVEEIASPQREVYLVTDGQRVNWQKLSAQSRRLLGELGAAGRLLVIAEANAGAENLGVVDLTLVSGALQRGAIARYRAKVHNFGEAPQTGVEVKLLVDGVPTDSRFVARIGAGESLVVPLHALLQRAGGARLAAETPHDGLDVDNSRRAVAQVRGAIRVLCVDGAPSDRPFEGSADFVLAALTAGSERGAGAVLSVTPIPWLALPSVRLSDYEVVILANVPDVAGDGQPALRDFVEQGGGLFVFAGKNMEGAQAAGEGRPGAAQVLPARVLSVEGDPASASGGWRIDAVMPDHLITRGLGLLSTETVTDCRFRRFAKVEACPDSHVVLRLTSDDPLLVDRRMGGGRVLFFASSPDRTWNNMVLSPAYPILLQQAVTHLLRRANEEPFTVGDALALPTPGQAVGTEFAVSCPDSQVRNVRAAAIGGQLVVDAGRAGLCGFYDFRPEAADGPEVTVAVNADVRESDVTCLEADALRSALEEVTTAEVLAGDDGIAEAVRRGRVGRELWRHLAIAAICLLVVESIVAKRYSRRKQRAAAR